MSTCVFKIMLSLSDMHCFQMHYIRNSKHHWSGPYDIIVTDQSAQKRWADWSTAGNYAGIVTGRYFSIVAR